MLLTTVAKSTKTTSSPSRIVPPYSLKSINALIESGHSDYGPLRRFSCRWRTGGYDYQLLPRANCQNCVRIPYDVKEMYFTLSMALKRVRVGPVDLRPREYHVTGQSFGQVDVC